MTRGRAERVVGVLSRQRRAPSVLFFPGPIARAGAVIERELRDQVARAGNRQGEILADLAAALDGWGVRASSEDRARIQEIRERWGIGQDDERDGEP